MKRLPLFIAILVSVVYGALFWDSIAPFWFNPGWTTDDAMQQVYPFNKAIYPDLFNGEFVSSLMERYLTPIHYWLGIGLTHLTGDPVMTAHWMMLIQIGLALVGMFLAVRGATCSNSAGVLAAVWLLHSRPVIQRLTAGLVRGWALPLFCFYLWAANTRRYRVCLALLLVGCFLHPPGTFLLGITHALFLLTDCIVQRTITRSALLAALCAPVIAVSAWYVTQMPPEIGTMATVESSMNVPEMVRPYGRFAFVPLEPLVSEVRTFAFQAFISRFYAGDKGVRDLLPWLVLAGLAALLWHDFSARREKLVAPTIWCFGLAVVIVYALAREFAFKLYVPDRHLQLPGAVFFIAAFSTAISRLWHAGGATSRRSAVLAGGLLALTVLLGSGLGLDGTLNFNRTRDQKGAVFAWARKYTPLSARFAGHPNIIDPMMLFGARAVYISFETSHPFYDKYLAETRIRVEQSLRAHFATNVEPLLQLADAGNDYFVFDRKIFRDLSSAGYGPPFGGLVHDLATQSPQVFYYFRDRIESDPELVPFADRYTLVVDLRVLRARSAS